MLNSEKVYKIRLNFDKFLYNEYEVILLVLMLLFIFVAILLLNFNYPAYKQYVSEDSVIEWATAFSLLGCSLLSLIRMIRLTSEKSKVFLFCLLIFTVLFLFGMGEEISWGQRIFNKTSTDFFTQNNSQEETNIHNLIICGIRLNKLIFSTILGIVIFGYVFILPNIYDKFHSVRFWVNNHAIPLARRYHRFLYLVLIILISSIHASDNWELLEFAGSSMFLIIMLNPKNKNIFTRNDKSIKT